MPRVYRNFPPWHMAIQGPNHRLQPGWKAHVLPHHPMVIPFSDSAPPNSSQKIYIYIYRVNVKQPGLQTCICIYIYKAFKMSSSHVVRGDLNWDFRSIPKDKFARSTTLHHFSWCGLWPRSTLESCISLVMTNTITNLCQVRMISESHVWNHLSNTTC